MFFLQMKLAELFEQLSAVLEVARRQMSRVKVLPGAHGRGDGINLRICEIWTFVIARAFS